MELIVIDDGEDAIEDLVPNSDMLRYYRLDQKITLGAKLNLACEYARGDIIAHWDDDDWYSPVRIRYQVDTLEREDYDLCGINKLLYYDLRHHQAYRYIYPPDQRTWLLGSSLCYRKKIWNTNRFADINIGMDGLFVWRIPPNRVKALQDSSISVHMIHDNNISPKQTNDSWWHSYPVEEIKKIMAADWNFYSNETGHQQRENVQVTQSNDGHEMPKPVRPLQNIYACLVHENETCIIDLVRNLHYHDPASVILLYNGGENPALLQDQSAFKPYNVVVHPEPVVVKHGYLHPFAFETMRFAVKNFSFDCITIVDSDQLAIRAGYPAQLAQFFSSRSNVGILSSNPEKIKKDNRVNHVALQAFKEYDLWKPLLNSFPGGEEKFVHWTFWPSTVFTSEAAKDLDRLFQNNKLLQDIVQRSKIWASEEVILPTLVSLLGYEIAANPCSYKYVQYRKTYNLQDLENAFNDQDAYWVHPITRKYDDPLRTYIRNKFNNYYAADHLPGAPSETEFFSRTKLINELNAIEGWLSDKEVDLLITSTINCLKNFPPPHHIVEIGSYHGKSTILFGKIAKHSFPGTRIHAIDTHDGKLGAADQPLQVFAPSFEAFKKNIENAGVSDTIDTIKDNSYNVNLGIAVSLLFIDGLHDYMNVARDFSQFSSSVRPGGYVIFHDYAPYFPGVMRCVDELLVRGSYRLVAKVDSLIVLKKMQS